MNKERELPKGEAELAKKHCVPCGSRTKPLKGEKLAALLWHLEEWKCVKEHHLEKEFEFEDFARALAFVNACGKIAEKEQHHPDLFLKWGLVRAQIYTHSIDGLCEADFVLAAKIDQIKRP